MNNILIEKKTLTMLNIFVKFWIKDKDLIGIYYRNQMEV